MKDVPIIRGREQREEHIRLIHDLLVEHPQWCRTQLSNELCHRWNWRNARGRIKLVQDSGVDDLVYLGECS